jgi:diacylglycerol kinase family enzyme
MGQTVQVRLALIANPGSGTAPDPGELEELLAAGGADVTRVPIGEIADGDGGELRDGALDALTAGCRPDRFVVAGGDGSIGPAALCAAELGRPLAVVPAGTANDFARTKELPLELEDACALARDPQAATAAADLGLAACRPFVNAASAGLAVIAADAAKPHKARLGPLAYKVGALLAGMTASPLHCAVFCDGERAFDGRAWQVVVGVTGAFGGGSEIGATRPDDGLLDVAVVPAGPRLALARRAFGMRTGRLAAQDGVTHERGAVIVVRTGPDTPFNVDGETCRCEPARFTLHPEGLDVVTPA